MDLSGKKVAIYGLGVSGLAVYKFLSHRSLAELLVVNRGPRASWSLPDVDADCEITLCEEQEASEKLALCDLIILSPGIPREAVTLSEAMSAKVPVWNEVELAARYFKGTIIAVTGTNGKTTTVSFLGELLKNEGKSVFVGGNIGIPFVTAIDDGHNFDTAVLELSSFQCESLEKFRASYNVILNLAPNHEERYASVEDYRLSKWQMVAQTTTHDHLWVGEGTGAAPFKLAASLTTLPEHWDNQFKEKFPWQKMQVIGKHNRYNLFFAWLVAQQMGIPEKTFIATLLDFKGVEHRVERLEKQLIFNDAKSTNWLATRTALEAVLEVRDSGQELTLIVGGQLRSADNIIEPETIEFLKKSCSRVFTIGEAGMKLAEVDEFFIYKETLTTAVESAGKKSDHDLVLFSPGFPSFDQFKNYVERGQKFKELARKILC